MSDPDRAHPMGRRAAALAAGACTMLLMAGCATAPVSEEGLAAGGAEQASPEDDSGVSPGSGQTQAGGDDESPATGSASPPAGGPGESGHDGDAEQDTGAGQDGETEPAVSEPALLEIPSIGISESLIDLAIAPDGTLEAPSEWDDVGWFSGGGKPGGPGPTVLAGHVDSPTGPAVFYRLLELEPGDEVEVTDVDGRVHTYRVDRVEDHPKDAFPTQEVFGAVAGDEIRLLTCTGEFDVEDQRHLDNRVVFASSVD